MNIRNRRKSICRKFWKRSCLSALESHGGTAKGMSRPFILLIMCGYVAGITAKIMNDKINYVLVAYIINLLIVSADLVVYYRNRHLDKLRENAENGNTPIAVRKKA